MQQNALSAFATNPNPQTAGAAARYDPGAVLQYNLAQQKEQAALGQQQLDQWHKYAGELAKWADTPEKWDQAVEYMVSHGHSEAAQLKGHFSPALRANFMALGGVQDEANAGQPKYFNVAPGGMVAALDPGSNQPRVIIAPNDGTQMSGAPGVPQAPSGDLRSEAIKAIQAGADPMKVLQRMQQLQGGQAATPSATFPGPN